MRTGVSKSTAKGVLTDVSRRCEVRVSENTTIGTSFEFALGSGGTIGVFMRIQTVEERREAMLALADMAGREEEERGR